MPASNRNHAYRERGLRAIARNLFARLVAASAGTALVIATATSFAQEYPARPVRIVVPFPAGGNADLHGRSLAQRLGRIWGHQVVIDNISGAGGGVAAANVAKSRPNGETIFFATHPILAINPFMYDKLAYDPDADFVPVIKVSEAQNILLVSAASSIYSVADLIRMAKEKPRALNFGSGGVGTTQHLTAELFKAAANIEITHVPYRGTAPATTALLANEIQMHFDSASSAISQIRGGRVRGIAITSLNRLPTMPDLPTLNESGLKGFEATLAYGLLVPSGTPPGVVAAINRDANKVLQDAVYRKEMLDQGLELSGGSPGEFRTFLLNERRKWGELISRLNIKAG